MTCQFIILMGNKWVYQIDYFSWVKLGVYLSTDGIIILQQGEAICNVCKISLRNISQNCVEITPACCLISIKEEKWSFPSVLQIK